MNVKKLARQSNTTIWQRQKWEQGLNTKENRWRTGNHRSGKKCWEPNQHVTRHSADFRNKTEKNAHWDRSYCRLMVINLYFQVWNRSFILLKMSTVSCHQTLLRQEQTRWDLFSALGQTHMILQWIFPVESEWGIDPKQNTACVCGTLHPMQPHCKLTCCHEAQIASFDLDSVIVFDAVLLSLGDSWDW